MGGTVLPSAPNTPPLLLVDGHNLLWGATFGFPAEIRSRDKTRLLTGLFGFFALLRVAIREDLPGTARGHRRLRRPVRRQRPPGHRPVLQGPTPHRRRRARPDPVPARRQTRPRPLRHRLDRTRPRRSRRRHRRSRPRDPAAPRPILIMSRDRDYYQLVTDRVSVLNTKMRSGQRHIGPAEVLRPATRSPRTMGRLPRADRRPRRQHPRRPRHRRQDRRHPACRRPHPRRPTPVRPTRRRTRHGPSAISSTSPSNGAT